jgi:hypothetical protein
MSPETLILESSGPCTVYLPGFFGYQRVEVRSISVAVKQHAQYPHAYVVRFIEKGKRTLRGQVLSHDPRGLIVEGHGHPAPASPMDAQGDGTSISRHSSCSKEWHVEFAAFVAEKLAGARVLLDITNTTPEAAAKRVQGAA